jgi:signal transduction histidine kinase
MEKIIDNLLFLSRIEASNKIKFTERILLDEILLKVFESREQSARNKGINFEIKKIIPAQVKGDKTLLERLISNIIDNAIRYTPSEARIEINLERNDRFALLSIRDTGIGIPEEALPFIFDRFYVVDKSRCKESGGAGLGLSIVKSVADSHGAIIDIQSKINQGTTFRVKFPLF